MAEAHTLSCVDSAGRRGVKRQPELITRAGIGLDSGFGVGFIDGTSRVIYDMRVEVPKPIRPHSKEIRLRPKYDPSQIPLRMHKGLRAKVMHIARPPLTTEQRFQQYASNYDVEIGKVSITGTRYTKGDHALSAGSSAMSYVEAGAGGGRQLQDYESWRLASVIVQEIMLTLVHSGPSVKLNK